MGRVVIRRGAGAAPALGTIADLSATAGDTQVVLAWTAAANATSHQPQYRASGSGTWLDFGSALGGSATGVTVTGLTNDQAYEFSVVAGDGVTTTRSNVETATPVASGSVADPTQLPLAQTGASSVLPTLSTVAALQSGAAAGGTYTDPYTDVTVLRVSASGTPASGSFEGGYAEGGPHISQSWESGGVTYYTAWLAGSNGSRYLVDIRYDTLALSNWRTVPSGGEVAFCFSLDPATPQIAYLIDGTQVRRYDTATDAYADTGNFPWTGLSSPQWLFTQINDTWLSLRDGTSLKAFKPSTGATVELTAAEWGLTALDELRMDRSLAYVYPVSSTHGEARYYWDLEADSLTAMTLLSPSLLNFSHAAVVKGGIVNTAATQDAFETDRGAAYWRADTDTEVNFTSPQDATGFHGASNDWYNCGLWCLNQPGSGFTDQWIVSDRFQSDDAGAKIRRGMVAWTRLSDGQVRLACSHGSAGGSYDTYPQTNCSPDGKLVAFTSDMNGSGRFDLFIAKMPVS